MAERGAGARIRKSYIAGRYGQIHLRRVGEDSGVPPLICLHATAYSSRSFEPLMRALAPMREVIALDLPGYGESDPPPAPLSIAGYAAALGAAIAQLAGARPVALFGYHTGAAIAAEIALQGAAPIEHLTMLGVPHFAVLDFAAWKARLASPHALTGDLDQFAERWRFLVSERPAGLSLRRGFANFVDELKAWPHGAWAHQALFDYDLADHLARLTCPVTILNPQGHLAEPSRAAAALIKGARLIELPELSGAVLDGAAEAIAALIPSAAEFSHRGNIAGTPPVDRPIRAG